VAGVAAAAAEGAEDAREVMTVSIEHAPRLEWCPSTHASFPGCFRDAARALVLAHARLATEAAAPAGAGCSPRGCGASLGSLPVHLRDVILALAAPRVPLYLPVRMPRPQTPEAGAGA
jgi:hypothetical protein